MTGAAAKLPPLDPNAAPVMADADRKRRERYLRKALIQGSLSPSRRRMLEAELREVTRGKPDGASS